MRGTSYSLADTDLDGIKDGDEVLGTLAGLNLPAMGVNPRRKDVLIEMDWVDEAAECEPHSHRPIASTIDEVKLFYASLPITNPNGQTGINFIADFGQGGAFTGGNFISVPGGIVHWIEGEHLVLKANHFNPNRIGYFRYQIHAHRWIENSNSSGIADVVGDNSLVTLNCFYNNQSYVRNTIIHELGHNFSLRHGGDTNCQGKANYNSVMNYLHQFPGLDVDCDRRADGVDNVGHSLGTRNTLTHDALSEAAGVCPIGHPQHKAIDWNGNFLIDPGLVSTAPSNLSQCGLTTVSDFNDVAALVILPAAQPGGGGETPKDPTDPCSTTPEP